MDKKITGILAYFGLIGWLIAFLAGDREGAKQHLNQALVLAIVELILGVVSSVFLFIPIIGWIISALCGLIGILLLVLAILGIVNAATGKDAPLPLIGGISILK